MVFFSKQSRDILILNLFLFIVGFSIPFSFSFNSISIAILFLYSFKWFKVERFSLLLKQRFNLPVLFVIFFCVQFLGVFYSDNLDLGFSHLIKNIVFLILPITFINLSEIIRYKNISASIYGLIIAVLTILLSIHSRIFLEIFSSDLEFKSLLTNYVRVSFVNKGFVEIHPPYFGMLVVFCLGVVVGKNKILTIKSVIINYLLIIYLIISLYGISSVMSIVLLCFLFVLYLLSLLRTEKIKNIIFLLLALTLLIEIIKLNYKSIISYFPGESLLGRLEWSILKGKGDTSRPENWKSVLSVVKENMLFGVGIDGGINQLQKYRSKGSESYINKHNAHNQYLEILLRHGMIGLIIYLAIINQLFLLAIKSRDKNFCWFMLVFTISSITESYLERQIGLTFFTFYALFYGMFFKFDSNLKNSDEKSINT